MITSSWLHTSCLNQLYGQLWSLTKFPRVLDMWTYLLHGLYNLLLRGICCGFEPQAFFRCSSWKLHQTCQLHFKRLIFHKRYDKEIKIFYIWYKFKIHKNLTIYGSLLSVRTCGCKSSNILGSKLNRMVVCIAQLNGLYAFPHTMKNPKIKIPFYFLFLSFS